MRERCSSGKKQQPRFVKLLKVREGGKQVHCRGNARHAGPSQKRRGVKLSGLIKKRATGGQKKTPRPGYRKPRRSTGKRRIVPLRKGECSPVAGKKEGSPSRSGAKIGRAK